MEKIRKIGQDSLGRDKLAFFCPGCENVHAVVIGDDGWEFNSDYENPTFNPSVLVDKEDPERICHSRIEDGKIKFYNDCHHELAGQVVELPEV